MYKKCVVCNLWSHNVVDDSIYFHRFPSNVEIRNMWLSLVGIFGQKAALLPDIIYLCSKHFQNEDFFMKGQARCLKKGALPLPKSAFHSEANIVSSDSPPAIEFENSDEGDLFTKLPLPQKEKQDSLSESTDEEEECSEKKTFPKRKRVLFSRHASSSTVTASDPDRQKGEMTCDTSDTLTISKGELAEQIKESSLLKELLDVKTSLGVKPLQSSSETLSATEEPCGSGEKKCSSLLRKRPYKENFTAASGKKRKRYVGDINSDDFSTPRKAKFHFGVAKAEVIKHRKKIATLNTRVRRMKSKVTTLNSLIKLLKENERITEAAVPVLKGSIPPATVELFENLLLGPKKQKYTPRLRTFALTLNFYSPKAYTYVRTMFNNTLPHPRTLSKWYQTVDGSPGFTKEALTALKLKVAEASKTNKTVLCNLVMDEMAIRKRVEWTGTKFTGFVDIGTSINNDELPEAKEALVFMLVALNDQWKIPVGYFLIDGLSGKSRAPLVKQCLEHVHETGVIVTSLTFDGVSSNSVMAKELGANFDDIGNLKTSFPHPKTGDPVYIFFDPVHMIKLVRNCFGSKKVLINSENEKIEWKYLEYLVELQKTEGLQAATKLKLRHLNWQKEKMKVKIATQTLSKSVADALLYLSTQPNKPLFLNAKPSADFILMYNNVFDIFNSRNVIAKYPYKRPICQRNSQQIFQFFDKVQQYTKGLRVEGIPVLKSDRKTGFLGFLICMKSLRDMYQELVVEQQKVKFILTYKLSQDHLELFFCAMRSRGGHNNNPTARQFEASYKRLLIHTEVKASDTGNAINLENIPILHCSSGNLTTTTEGEELELSEEYISTNKEIETVLEDHDYIGSKAWSLTDYSEDVVAYIAGFIVRSLKKCVACQVCVALLETNTIHSGLQAIKEYKKLCRASSLIIEICVTAEKKFREFNKTRNIFNRQFLNCNVNSILVLETMNIMPSSVFIHFDEHLYDDSPIDNHCMQLIKLCLSKYFTIRIHYECRKRSDCKAADKVRSILTKTILFKNQ